MRSNQFGARQAQLNSLDLPGFGLTISISANNSRKLKPAETPSTKTVLGSRV